MKLTPIEPFEPVRSEQVPTGEDWIAQVKWDGVRMLVYCDGSEVRLINRRLHDRTRQYPELAEPASWCKANSFVLDGEVIALRDGLPSFYAVMKRDSLRSESAIRLTASRLPVTYMIFDLLYLNGEWITGKPLHERQALLGDVVRPQEHVQLVDSVPDGESLLAVMKQYGIEGIVCKRLGSIYAPGGKDARWQKVKLFRDLVASVGGVTLRGNTVNSLMLGLYTEDDRFLYIGHAGTGKLGQADWRVLTERLMPLRVERRPFANVPQREKDAIWVKPEVAVKVKFLEWTPQGTMRHPSIQAIVDVPAELCRFSE